MAASNQDYFTEVGNPGSATTLAAPGHTIAGTTFNVGSTSNWPTATGVIFAVDTVSIVSGVTTRNPGTYTEWEGVVSNGTTISNATLRYGTDQNYPAGSTTRVYIPVASSHENRMAQGLLLSVFDNDATMKAGAVDNAAVLSSNVVTTTKILDANVTTAKLADGSITSAKLSTAAGDPGADMQSWVGTVVGWSSTTASEKYYKQIGKMVYFVINYSGTSNTSAVTFTLPVPIKTGQVVNLDGPLGLTLDAGSVVSTPGRWSIVTTDPTPLIACARNQDGSGFASSGTKGVRLQGFYPAA